ncbi:hypothetical protein [Nitrosomonas ureae]|uniref:Uncharacterized protein n=1 Tax=Nitrosomonas ureae TaxID=44577 RepID=A0A2T5ISX4_9PROT|nr:hypothetical protein [Nitrosomonas ureae]PTQ86934.1 hypothetical protein C8R28_1008129 [Nitrosomonas ureae]
MEGISKERLESQLKRISLQFDYDPTDRMIRMLKQLIMECTELNPWIPIDEDTPIDKELILYYPAGRVNHVFLPKIKLIGYHRPQLSSICRQPSHYQELIKDPT